MGTNDPSERELLQGLIKLAAAFVHAARGNAAGVAKNLRGARSRLEMAGDAGEQRIDVGTLIAAIDRRLSAPVDPSEPPIAIAVAGRDRRS